MTFYAAYTLRPRIKVEKDMSPELPSTLEEILADIRISENKQRRSTTSQKRRHSARTARANVKRHQPMEIYNEESALHDEDHVRIEFCPYCGAGVVEDLIACHLNEDCTEYANYASD